MKRRGVLVAALGVVGVAAFFANPFTRWLVIGVLRQEHFYDRRPTSYWLNGLKDPDSSVRRRAAYALAYGGDWEVEFTAREAEAAVPGLIDALRDEDMEVRCNAVYALGGNGPRCKPAIPAMISALTDRVPGVRKTAARALWRLSDRKGEPEVLSALTAALKDPDPGVRMESAYVLWRVGGSRVDVVPVLVAILKDPSTNPTGLRRDAAEYLGDMGAEAREAIPALEEALEDESDLLREKAAAALERITRADE